MTRDEYLVRAREFQPRGEELPQARLTDESVAEIRSAMRQREALRGHIREVLSNEALARRYSVSVRAIERISQRETWAHVG